MRNQSKKICLYQSIELILGQARENGSFTASVSDVSLEWAVHRCHMQEKPCCVEALGQRIKD